MNKKGFTLIELLAALVILGILFTIAAKGITNYVSNSKVSVFISLAKEEQLIASQELVLGNFYLPTEENEVTIISTSLLQKEKNNGKSPFGGTFLENKSYVAIVNAGTFSKPNYKYYVALQDVDRNALPLTDVNKIEESTFRRNAKNRMELTVQAFCGTKEGISRSLYTIKGLEEMQQKDEYGYNVNWEATIYSSDSCGRTEL